MRLEVFADIDLGQPLGQLRAAPMRLGDEQTLLLAYGADYDVDPFHEMFFFPTDTLKLAVAGLDGRIVWRKDLGRGVVPGMSFCPVLPFDLDSDGVDEIWFVNNIDPNHPLSQNGRRLERLDARTGESTGQWPWPRARERNKVAPGEMFREFLLGGFVHGTPVLITAQGTYAWMTIQAWNADMSMRWEVDIRPDAPGARGSHMCPIIDIDNDGVDELLWGERCISLDNGHQLFCCDEETWRGHSDMVQPVRNRADGSWTIYTFRESDGPAPRVAMYDSTGKRIWGAIDVGHMDMGWAATLRAGERQTLTTIRIRSKGSGAAGHVHRAMEEFAFDIDGLPIDFPFSHYQTLPVDLNGDGVHELVRGLYAGDGAILDPQTGETIASVGAAVRLGCKFAPHPGEQLLTMHPDGHARLWRDRDAVDSDIALSRYALPFYQTNRRFTASGFNLHVFGGV